MSERARQLAERFDEATREMIATIERLSDAEWARTTSAEGWTVGVVAHHVAQNHEPLAGLVKAVASGQPLPPLTLDQIHQANAEHARAHAGTGKAETLALFRKGAAAVSVLVCGLTDAELDRSAPVLGSPMTAAQLIERILIGHVHQHHGSIRDTLGRS